MLDDYIQQALRTESTLHEDRILHGVLGIVTESAELMQGIIVADGVNIKEELGDIMWYMAILMDEIDIITEFLEGIPPIEIPKGESLLAPACSLSVSAGALTDLIKRCLFYGSAIPEDELGEGVLSIFVDIISIAAHQGITLKEICDKNIEKLEERYPEKFTKQTALERDLERERKILEN